MFDLIMNVQFALIFTVYVGVGYFLFASRNLSARIGFLLLLSIAVSTALFVDTTPSYPLLQQIQNMLLSLLLFSLVLQFTSNAMQSRKKSIQWIACLGILEVVFLLLANTTSFVMIRAGISTMLSSLDLLYHWGKTRPSYKNHADSIVLVTIGVSLLGVRLDSNLCWGLIAFFFGFGSLFVKKHLAELSQTSSYFEYMPLGVVIDTQGIIVKVSSSLLETLGYDSMQWEHQPLRNYCNDERLLHYLSNPCQEPLQLEEVLFLDKDNQDVAYAITVSFKYHWREEQFVMVGIKTQRELALKPKPESKPGFDLNALLVLEQLEHSDELLSKVLETMPFGVIFTNLFDHTILYANQVANKMFVLPTIGLSKLYAYEHYEQESARNKLLKKIKNGEVVHQEEVVFKRRDGTLFVGEITMELASFEGQEALLSVIGDITLQKLLEQQSKQSEIIMKNVMDSIPDMVFVTDMNAKINYVNQSTIQQLGYQEIEMVHTNLDDFLEASDVDKVALGVSLIDQIAFSNTECMFKKKNGMSMIGEINASIFSDDHKQSAGIIFVVRDSSERNVIAQRLRDSTRRVEEVNEELVHTNSILKEQSIRDGLTSLYNHQHINHVMTREIQLANSLKHGLCCMMLDIDFFKKINDTYGHQFGDQVLVGIADVIKHSVRTVDYVGRYGGEEFIVILPMISMADALKIAERIRYRTQVLVFGYECRVSISIGVAQWSAEDVETLINKADSKLYLAKENGRNRIEA